MPNTFSESLYRHARNYLSILQTVQVYSSLDSEIKIKSILNSSERSSIDSLNQYMKILIQFGNN